MAAHWIGVASADHVARGIAGGFAQLGHGQRTPLARVAAGDRLVYYASLEAIGEGVPLRAFVAIGTVTDRLEQHGSGAAGPGHPWRRRVDYDERVQRAPIHPLLTKLNLTRFRGAHRGVLFRRSLIGIDAHDVGLIEAAMHAH